MSLLCISIETCRLRDYAVPADVSRKLYLHFLPHEDNTTARCLRCAGTRVTRPVSSLQRAQDFALFQKCFTGWRAAAQRSVHESCLAFKASMTSLTRASSSGSSIVRRHVSRDPTIDSGLDLVKDLHSSSPTLPSSFDVHPLHSTPFFESHLSVENDAIIAHTPHSTSFLSSTNQSLSTCDSSFSLDDLAPRDLSPTCGFRSPLSIGELVSCNSSSDSIEIVTQRALIEVLHSALPFHRMGASHGPLSRSQSSRASRLTRRPRNAIDALPQGWLGFDNNCFELPTTTFILWLISGF